MPKTPRYRPVVVLSPHDVQRFRTAVAGHRYALIYDLYLFTGMREGEVRGMQWANLEWATDAYHLTHDLDLRSLQLDTLKTEKSRRTLYFPAPLVTALRSYYLDQQRLADDAEWNALGLIFYTVHGTPVRANNLWRYFHRTCAVLGLPPKTTVHHLRHTFRHHAADHMGAHVMQDWMGHSGLATTFEICGDGASERAKQAAAARLEGLYNETP